MDKADGAQPKDRTRGKSRLPSLMPVPWLESAVAPLTLAITGMMFLAGWTERNTLLKKFGISASIVPEPIQLTLARGYLPLLAGIAISGIALGIAWLITKSSVEMAAAMLARAKSRNIRYAARYASSRALKLGLALNLTMLMLLIGYGSGIVSADIKAKRITRAVQGECQKCFSYGSGDRTYVGRVLAQNDTRTVLLTPQGIVLLETGKISSVIPYRRPVFPPSRPLL